MPPVKAKTQAAEDFLNQGAPKAAAAPAGGAAGDPTDFLNQGAPQGWNATAEPQAPPQNNSVLRKPLMGLSAAAGAVGNFLGLPGDIDRGLTAGANWVTGNNIDTGKLGVLPLRVPSSGDISSGLNKLGVTGRSDLMPNGPLEEYGTAGVSGLTTGAMAALTGGTSLLPNLAAGFVGSEAGEAAQHAFPNNKWAPVVAGLVSGLGVGGLTSSIMRSVGASRAAKALEDAQAQLERAHNVKFYGGENSRIATAGIKDASEKALEAKQGLINTVVADANKATADTFEHTAAKLGTSATLQQAGESMQGEARNWLTTILPKKLKEAWAPVDAQIPADHPLDLAYFQQALKDINSSAGELEPLASLLKPSLPKKLGEVLANKTDEAALHMDEAPTYNWKDVSKLRTTLGDALHNPQVIKDVGAENLDRLYAGLSSDMQQAAEASGAGDAFRMANMESRALYQTAEGPIARLVAGAKRSVDDPNPESVAASLISGGKKGATDLAALRAEIPAGVDELAAAHLRTSGLKDWGKLAPETRAALVPTAEHSAALDQSLAARVQAEANAERELLAARRDHAETSAAADESHRTGNFSRSEQVRLAQDAMARAKAGLPPPEPPLQNIAHSFERGLGLAAGYQFGPALLAHLGIEHNPLNMGAIYATGLALPAVGRAVKGAVKNPGPTVVGGLAGGNALTLKRK